MSGTLRRVCAARKGFAEVEQRCTRCANEKTPGFPGASRGSSVRRLPRVEVGTRLARGDAADCTVDGSGCWDAAHRVRRAVLAELWRRGVLVLRHRTIVAAMSSAAQVTHTRKPRGPQVALRTPGLPRVTRSRAPSCTCGATAATLRSPPQRPSSCNRPRPAPRHARRCAPWWKVRRQR